MKSKLKMKENIQRVLEVLLKDVEEEYSRLDYSFSSKINTNGLKVIKQLKSALKDLEDLYGEKE